MKFYIAGTDNSYLDSSNRFVPDPLIARRFDSFEKTQDYINSQQPSMVKEYRKLQELEDVAIYLGVPLSHPIINLKEVVEGKLRPLAVTVEIEG